MLHLTEIVAEDGETDYVKYEGTFIKAETFVSILHTHCTGVATRGFKYTKTKLSEVK